MRITVTLTAVAITAALMASCNKETGDMGTGMTFRATSESVSANGKVEYNGGQLLWQSGDQISIYDAVSNAAVFALASGEGTANAVFSQLSGTNIGATPYTAVYPAAIRTAANTVNLPAVQKTPDGSLTGIPMYAVSNDMELKFYHLCGVVRFRLSTSGDAVSVSRISVATDRNTNGAATISGGGSTVSISTPSGDNVTVLACDYGQSISSAHDFYMYLPAGTYSTFRILMTAADGSLCSKSANRSIVVERGKITTITLSNLSFTAHRFSTSSTTSVVFSPGNLQYIGSAATPYWKFADRQTDYFGTTTGQNSAAINVDRDLFGWGTSGWNNGNAYYQPYSTFGHWSSRGMGSNYYGPQGDNYSLTDSYAQADWGVYNAIRNGGNHAGMWRTPTSDEWNYLFNSRDCSTIGTSENCRYCLAQVGGIGGVLLIPDYYLHPNGVAEPSNINGRDHMPIWGSNNYSRYDWQALESAGCVFLSAAGYRDSTTVLDFDSWGDYWLSTNNGGYKAYYMDFRGDSDRGDNYVYPHIHTFRIFGFAVRLVR